jgi:hypothetical protein
MEQKYAGNAPAPHTYRTTEFGEMFSIRNSVRIVEKLIETEVVALLLGFEKDSNLAWPGTAVAVTNVTKQAMQISRKAPV